MKHFFDLCFQINRRMFWAASLFLLVGQTAGAYAPGESPSGRGAPKVLDLGNRVFQDYNRDGIQNDSDPGVSGLTIRLFRGGGQRGITTTDATGQYSFNNANVSEGLLPNTAYEIRIATADFNGLVLTQPNQGGDTNLDSDAQIVSAGLAVIYATTNANNTPNDSYDVGLAAEAPNLNIIKSATASPVVLGGNASFTIQVSNSSTGAATNVVVKDTLGAGMTYVSASPAPTITTTPTSQTVLTWNFGTVLGGATTPGINLTVNTTSEGVLYNTAYVTTTDTEPNTANNVSRACVTVPIKLCAGDEYVASLPSSYTNVQWYRNGTLITTGVSGGSLTITQAGSYSFTTTSNIDCPTNGCCPIIVEDGIVPTLAITPAAPAICAGASTTLSLTGCGTGSILWSTGQSTASIIVSPVSTTAGVYSVSCVSNTYGTCTAAASTTVTVNPNPVVALSSATICAGATASLTATAGFASYVFSTGLTTTATPNVATGTTTGTYSVTATTTEGCSGTATGTITVNPLPTASIVASSLTICQGESTSLTASGGTTYLWSTSATTASIIVTTSGVYSVTVSNAEGCSDVASTTITVNPAPVLTVSSPSLTVFAGASTTLTVGGCAGTLVWSTGDNTASLVVAPLVTTTYSATCTLSTGCSSTTSATVTVNPAPSYTTPPRAVAATCSGAVANSDARIVLTTLTNTERIDYVLGSTYGSGPAYGAASNQVVTGGAVTITNLPNPGAPQPYTLRLFSAGGTYFIDVTLTLSPAECICPAPKCVPIVIRKIQ